MKSVCPKHKNLLVQIKTVQGLVKYLEQAKNNFETKLICENEEIDRDGVQAYMFKKAADKQKNLLDKVPKDILEVTTKSKVKADRVK